MRGAALLAILCAASWAVAQDIRSCPATGVPVFATVAGLPSKAVNGSLALAANCRAVTGVATLNSGFTVQAAGSGTGCLVSYTSSGNAWQIAGTATTASQ